MKNVMKELKEELLKLLLNLYLLFKYGTSLYGFYWAIHFLTGRVIFIAAILLSCMFCGSICLAFDIVDRRFDLFKMFKDFLQGLLPEEKEER